MFLGQYDLNFSGKNRLVLPKKFRENLGAVKELVLTRGLDGCIWGFPKLEWEKQAEEQTKQPLTEKESRDLRRYLFSAAEAVDLDDQSRFIIPGVLINYARIKTGATLIGAGEYFEIWDKGKWKRKLKEILESREE